MKNVNNTTKKYFSDDELYIFWKYLNSDKLVDKNVLNFYDLTPLKANVSFMASELILMVKLFKGELIGLKFHKDIYLKYCQKEYKETIKFTKEKKELELAKAIKKVFDNKYNLDDVLTVCFYEKSLMCYYFDFDKVISEKVKVKLSELLDKYIKNFIKDELVIDKQNYYKFEKQKQLTFEMLSPYINRYGKQFIFKKRPDVRYIPWDEHENKVNEYLFIHSLIALEKLGYLDIKKIWIIDDEEYNIKLLIKQKYIDKLEDKKIFKGITYKNGVIKKRPEVKMDSIESLVKYENGILKFRSKEINFRNKQNQKDLLATIFEEPKKNWSYDEIQEKWDEMMKLGVIDYPKNYWKKFYSAGDDINKAVAIETQVKDFITKNTKEIRINPKYI